MSIQFIGSASGGASVTIPPHQVGDFIMICAMRAATATLPTSVSGWTAINSNTANTMGWRIAYRIATTTNHTSGTWTNATHTIVSVWRNVKSPYFVTPSYASNYGGAMSIPSVPLSANDGSRHVVVFGQSKVNESTIEIPPSGLLLRENYRGVSNGEAVMFTTPAGVTEFPERPHVGDALGQYWKFGALQLVGDPPVAEPAPSPFKRFSAGGWLPAPVKKWTGSAWTVAPVKKWSGTAWEEMGAGSSVTVTAQPISYMGSAFGNGFASSSSGLTPAGSISGSTANNDEIRMLLTSDLSGSMRVWCSIGDTNNSKPTNYITALVVDGVTLPVAERSSGTGLYEVQCTIPTGWTVGSSHSVEFVYG